MQKYIVYLKNGESNVYEDVVEVKLDGVSFFVRFSDGTFTILNLNTIKAIYVMNRLYGEEPLADGKTSVFTGADYDQL